MSDDMDIDKDAGDLNHPQTRTGESIVKSVEGYVVMVLNIHEEASEEDVSDVFEEFGRIKSFHLNLDRQTGYAKGYALIEYERLEDAQRAVEIGNSEELLGNKLEVEFAFVELPPTSHANHSDVSKDNTTKEPVETKQRERSKSPTRDRK